MIGENAITDPRVAFAQRIAGTERRLADLERARVVRAGTWVPGYTYGGVARTPTANTGSWRRWGDVVFVTFTMLAGAIDSGGDIKVTGLPFVLVAPITFGAGRVGGLAFSQVEGVTADSTLQLRDAAGSGHALIVNRAILGSALYVTSDV